MPIRITEDQLFVCNGKFPTTREQVMALQHLLNIIHYRYDSEALEQDGILGPKTKELCRQTFGVPVLKDCQIEYYALKYFPSAYETIHHLLTTPAITDNEPPTIDPNNDGWLPSNDSNSSNGIVLFILAILAMAFLNKKKRKHGF